MPPAIPRTTPSAASVSNANAPTRFSVRVPEGNYRVTVHFGGSRKHTHARVLAEQRRLMLEDVAVDKKLERSFIVNVRTADLAPLPANATGGTKVALKPRETRQRHLGRQAHAGVRGRCARCAR